MKKTVRIKSKLNFKKERTAHKKKVVGMNFDDFKKEYLERMDTLEEIILETTTWGADQRNMIVEAFTKGIKRIDKDLVMLAKNFKALDDRLHALEGFTALMAIKFKEALQRKPMTFEERKAIAGIVSIKWDKADDKTYNKAA